MNIEKYKIDYSKLKVGDKLWSIQAGDCELESMDAHSYPLLCANSDWGRTSYTKDGRHSIYDTHPSLFTSNPFADNPEPVGLMVEKPESILQEAERIVSGDRDKDYGSVQVNFDRIAKMWSALTGIEISARMVGRMMIALKLSRDVHKPKRDNLTDTAGYAHSMDLLEKEVTK